MQASPEREIVTVTTTVGSRSEAEALAHAILEAGLAACVQLEEGLTSYYRWEGKAQQDAEVRLTIKTLASALPGLQALLGDKHPYDLPQFVAWPGQGSAAYADWVRAAVRPAAPGRIPGR